MTAQEFYEKAERFEGTAFVCFELNGQLLAIGRMHPDGPVEMYDHDYAEAGIRRPLATFEDEDTAAEVGAFVASLWGWGDSPRHEAGDVMVVVGMLLERTEE